jgi:hypothetical protein
MNRTLGYTGDRLTNTRPDGLDRMTNIRIRRITSVPLRPVPALANGQMVLPLDVKPAKAPRKRKQDYPAGPYTWTERQGRACFEAHAWGGATPLANALRVAWMEDRPPCYPPTSVIDADTAVTVLLNTFVRVHIRTRKEAHA